MNDFILLARPWWVNLLALIPLASYIAFRKRLVITKIKLITGAVFGMAFGFVEASVVVYLRAATGLLAPSTKLQEQALVLNNLPKALFSIEVFRETATIIMLATVALLAAKKLKQRSALFLWLFGFWDIFYYIWLWHLTKWPGSLTAPDVLFLIPVPWVAQVWFPCVVSGATLLAIAINSRSGTYN